MHQQNTAHIESRDRTSNYDLNRVDYEWVAKQTNVTELKKAYEALEIDACFPDLLKTCGERICELDPKFKRRMEGDKKLSVDEQKAVDDDIFAFLDTMNATDKKLQNLAEEGDKENKSIFSNEEPSKKEIYKSPLVIQLENQKVAENERMKGNEAVKSKEYQDAVKAYTRSIELNPDEAFTYANRAMAYLKLKNYGNVIMDANKAIELKPGYLKAFHRRGKAYAALGKHEQAIKDF